MPRSRPGSVSLVIAGILLLLSSAAHAGLGWPAMRHELTQVSALAVWHASDRYGQLVVYAGMNGIVPPASRP